MKKTTIFLIASLIVALYFSSFNWVNGQTRETILDRVQSKIRDRVRINLQEFEQNRAELKNLMNQNRIEFQNQIQERRELLKQQIAEYKNQLRERLQNIQNENKRKIVENIYERINGLNEIITNHYLNVLNHLEDILERIASRAAKAETNGLDTTKVKEAITKAQEKIDKAREEVKKQAEKIYEPPTITTEQNLKLEVGQLRQQLHTDLKAVEKVVKEARTAVKEAAITLAQIPKVDQINIPVSSPTP